MAGQEEQILKLQKVRERTLLDIERLREELQAEIEPAPATDDDAAADVAADIYERGKIISLIRGLESKIRSLDRAIELAGEGTYGICEKCGVEIPEGRLEIMPETTLCVQCASELEQGIRRSQLQSELRDRRRRVRLIDDEVDEDEDDEPQDYDT
ncbi:MAG: hypothetical protein FJZ90_02865 [Chloroflexi bacterium]|nr:hypothetical protein [Chloroflexota bacterium]